LDNSTQLFHHYHPHSHLQITDKDQLLQQPIWFHLPKRQRRISCPLVNHDLEKIIYAYYNQTGDCINLITYIPF
jgi:hypothetical protein